MALASVPAHPERLVYLGTPQVAVAPLEALVTAGFDVALVVTRADARRGRGTATSPSPVKEAAERLGLPVSHDVDDVLGAGADLGVVVAFGRLIRAGVLEQVPMVNLHFSLLPRWRGAAPVERALLAGDVETGVCVMQLEEGLDTGPVFACQAVPIGPDATLDSLRADLALTGTDLLVRSLREGFATPVAQEGVPTYAAKIEAADLQLDWSRPATELARIVRLGGAWTTLDGRRLKVLEARSVPAGPPAGALEGVTVGSGDGGLELVVVQPEGKGPMAADAWRRGARLADGTALGG